MKLSDQLRRLGDLLEDRLPLSPEAQRREAEFTALRKPLRRMTAMTFASAIPGLARQFERVIPEKAWGSCAGGSLAKIGCPCGAEPEAAIAEICRCENCERFYIFDGRSVHVANSPAGPPSADVH